MKALEEKLLLGVPFPYLLNESEFYQHRFFVNEDVLIPRPETELLVDLIAQSGRPFERALDVGTGSGVILLSLVKAGVAAQGVGSDISPAALKVASVNQRRLRLTEKTNLIESDGLKNVSGKFDLIVSNPPYIREVSQKSLVHPSVDRFEPHLALYLPEENYEEWFRNFFQAVLAHLGPGGEFWMEGHELELETQAGVLHELGFLSPQVIQDFSGRPRFLRAHAPK